MRPLLLIALLVGVGCSRRPVDAAEQVCKHAVDLCGKLADYQACLASVKEQRTVDLAAAEAAEACALQKKECRELATCDPRASTNPIKATLLHLRAKADITARGAVGGAAARIEELGAKPPQ